MAELDPNIILRARQNDFGNSLAGAIQGGVQTYRAAQDAELDKQRAARAEQLAPLQIQGAQYENMLKQHEVEGQLLSSAVDEPTYQRALKQASGLGIDISGLPPSYGDGSRLQPIIEGYKTQDQKLRELGLQIQQQRLQQQATPRTQSVTSPMVMDNMATASKADASPPDTKAIAAALGGEAVVDAPASNNVPSDPNEQIASLTSEYTRRAAAGEPAKNLQGLKNSISLLKDQAKQASGAPLPGDLAGRIGLANSYLGQADQIRTDLEKFGTGDRINAAIGRGDAGRTILKIESGADALRRGLTGAGMNNSEAADYVKRYLPTATDTKENLLYKHDQLVRELSSIQDTVKQGRPGLKIGAEAAQSIKMGSEQEGYVFMGGDPADQKNWKKR